MEMAMNLKAARINAGLSRKEVGKALEMHPNTIASYESYKTTPDMETAQKICKLYGCNFDDIKWSM